MCDYFEMYKMHKRWIFRVLIALCITIFMHYYLPYSKAEAEFGWGWMSFSALFVMLTSPGSSIYQGILRYIFLLLVVGIFSYLFSTTALMHLRIYDISLGAFIGIIVNSFILPDHIDVIFRSSITPIVKSYNDYFQSIMDLLLNQQQETTITLEIENKKYLVEKKLLYLPFWVYEAGFDLTLQKGYRYFLLKMNEIGEILFSMHHLARYPFSEAITAVITPPLLECKKKGDIFFQSVINILEKKQITEMINDFYQEIETMERSFKKRISLNALDALNAAKKENVYLIEFIYNLRELQELMLKMAETLRP